MTKGTKRNYVYDRKSPITNGKERRDTMELAKCHLRTRQRYRRRAGT